MKSLIRVNPKNRKTRDQTMRVTTAAVAGPALLFAGYKFPGSTGTRGLLMVLGAALIYTNYETFREALDGEEAETEEEEDLLASFGLTG